MGFVLLMPACGSDGPEAPRTTAVLSGASAGAATVLQITRAIPAGLSGDVALKDGYVSQVPLAAGLEPAKVVTNPDDLKGKFASAKLAEGQIVVTGMFVPLDELCDPVASSCAGS